MSEKDEPRRMIYNIRVLLEKGEGAGEGGGALGKREELGIHILGRGVLSLWDVGSSDFVFLALI